FKSHIATGHMFGQFISEKNVGRISWRMVDTLCEKAITRWDQIRTAYSSRVLLVEGIDEKEQPIRIGKGIAIDESNDISGRGFNPDIARGAQPLILSVDHSYFVSSRECSSIVIRSIVHHDNLVVRVVEQGERTQRFVNCLLGVQRWHYDRHARPIA